MASPLTTAAAVGLMALASGADQPGIPFRVETGRLLMKATPHVEGGVRCVYFQASTQSRDVQGERILARALIGSIPYFLRHGRIDLDHASVIGQIRGQRVDPYAWEIGRPLDARPEGDSVMVKAAIFSSAQDGNRWTEAADLFWDSLHTAPPVLWYPSVHGMVTNEAGVVDPSGLPTTEIGGLLWQSVGLSRTPVNPDVPALTTLPLRTFAKALGSAQGLAAVLRDLRGSQLAQSDLPGDLNAQTVQSVLEALAEGRIASPSALFEAMQAQGVPQNHTFAVLLALLGAAA